MTTETERLLVLMQFEADQAEKSAKRHERTLASLERQVDKLAPATARYNRQLKAVETLFETGRIDAARYASGIKLIEQSYDEARRKAGNLGATGNQLTSVLARNRSAFQQVGYQVGDFAVQVQGGQSALIAFTQQGSQLLGVMGAYGAIAGAALAVGAPLIASFLNSGEASATLEQRINGLIEAIDAYRAATNAIGTDDLAEKFGAASESMREILLAQRDLLELRALQELTEAITATVGEFGSLEGVARGARSGLNRFNQTVGELAERFDISETRASVLAYALRDLGEADGPEAQAAALKVVREQLELAAGGVEAMSDETREVYERMLDAEEAAVALASVDMTTEISNAASEAARLARNLQIAAGARADAAVGGNVDFFDPRNEAGLSGVIPENRPVPEQNRPGYKPKGGKRSGGGGGSRRQSGIDFNREITQLQRRLDLLGKTTEETAALETKWRLLDEAKRAGIEIDDAVNQKIEDSAAQVGRLTAALEQGRRSRQQFEQDMRSIADGLAGAIVQGRSLGDVLKNLAKQLLQRSLSNLFMRGLGRIGGGGIFGRLFGGIPSYSTGTNNHPGGLAQINERGGEIVDLPRGTRVIPHDVSNKMAGAARVEIVGGDLMLSDGGTIMTEVRVLQAQSAAAIQQSERAMFSPRVAEQQERGTV